MSNAIANRVRAVQPGRPQGPQLRVLPMIGPSSDQPSYRLLDQQTLPLVRVTEVSEAGSVPELMVENKLDVRVFLMDGQELVGAKQNRILNTDVVVPAASTLKIPVSCVEQGRWRHISDTFSSGKSASHRTRSRKQERVKAALRQTGKHDADQGAVWQEVHMSLMSAGAVSPTAALSDAYAKKQHEMTTFRRSLTLPPDAVGVAVFHGNAFQGLDLFDRHSTLKYFWESLLDSYAIELLGVAPTDRGEPADAETERRTVREALDRAASAKWESFASPGDGTDWRLEDERLSGSSLVCDESVIHLQLFPKLTDPEQQGARSSRPRIHRRYGRPGSSE